MFWLFCVVTKAGCKVEETLIYQRKNVLNVARQARETLFKTTAIGWRRKWQPTPVFLPGESHGQRSLAGHGPWGHRESDMTEVTKHACPQ